MTLVTNAIYQKLDDRLIWLAVLNSAAAEPILVLISFLIILTDVAPRISKSHLLHFHLTLICPCYQFIIKF